MWPRVSGRSWVFETSEIGGDRAQARAFPTNVSDGTDSSETRL
jgi:hypothetical protein